MITVGSENPGSVGCISDRWNQVSGGQRQVGVLCPPARGLQTGYSLSLDFLVSKMGIGICVSKGHKAQMRLYINSQLSLQS